MLVYILYVIWIATILLHEKFQKWILKHQWLYWLVIIVLCLFVAVYG